jgi:hypothetical protein
MGKAEPYLLNKLIFIINQGKHWRGRVLHELLHIGYKGWVRKKGPGSSSIKDLGIERSKLCCCLTNCCCNSWILNREATARPEKCKHNSQEEGQTHS